MATDVQQTNSKVEKQKRVNHCGHLCGQIGQRNYRRNDRSRRQDFSSATDTDGRNEQLRLGMSTGRADEAL